MRYRPLSTLHYPPSTWLMVGLCVFGLWHAPVQAANYYVATNGSNSNSGTSLASPFLTIQQAANMAQAGDNVYVRGGTYRETVTVANSGNSSAPITFQPYQNEDVTITGLTQFNSGWTQVAGQSYYQHTGVTPLGSSTPSAGQVFVGGNSMGMARWPNAGYNNPLVAKTSTATTATVQPSSSVSTITDTALGGVPDGTWTGASMAIKAGLGWTWKAPTVVGQTGNAINFHTAGDNQGGEWYAIPAAGDKYFLYNSLAALNAPGEWYQDAANSKLYLQTVNGLSPNGQNVEVRTQQGGFDLGSQNYVTVQGFRLKAASININGNHNTVNNCQVLYADSAAPKGPWSTEDIWIWNTYEGTKGITIGGQYNTITHSEIGYTGGNGITIRNDTQTATNNTITNNVIHDVGWSGNNSAGIYAGMSGGNNTFTNNTIYNSGTGGIALNGNTTPGAGPNYTIAHNDISRYAYLGTDNGGIYAWQSHMDGTTIAYNKVHDSRMGDPTLGETGQPWLLDGGIYLDGGTTGATVHHNLVTETQVGVLINGNSHNIYNNTFWSTSAFGSSSNPTYAMGSAMTGQTNITAKNNLSNSGSWVGNTLSNNRTQTANQFTNSAAGDYTLTANSGFTKRAVDYGTPIAGITDIDGYAGSNPDAGALERGVTIPDAHNVLTAGANWKAWTAGNQAAAPLDAAFYVTQSGTRVTTGSLTVGNTTSTSANNRSFLHFDLSGIVSTTIQSAILRIYENTTPTSAGSVTLNRVTSTWTNSNVSYNQSLDTASPITGFYDPSNLDLYTDINITSWVQGWLSNSSTNYGLRLCGSEDVTGTAKYFDGFYGVTAPQLVITMPESGDVNLDGKVDVSDLAILAANYRKHVSGGWTQADFNNDGVVDVQDLAILAANYRYGVASGLVPAYDGLDAAAVELLSQAGVTAVPEACPLIMLATGLIGVLAYAWRKRRCKLDFCEA